MESPENKSDYSFSYPKTKSQPNKFIGKKKKVSNVYDNNPLINHFNISSFFIFDQNDHIKYFNSLSNKNNIKLSNDEICFLYNIYNKINALKSLNNGDEFITLEEETFQKIKSFFEIKKLQSPLNVYIKEKISKSKNRSHLSCRKLANEYYKDTGIRTSKSTVNNIIRNELGYHFLKTTPKSNTLKTDLSILSCLCFIKIITRCLKLGFFPIFIDESKIELSNNHYKAWRFRHEQLYYGASSKDKINLLLAVGRDKIYHYKFSKENTTSSIFIDFLKELVDKIIEEKDNKYVLIMDNLPSHKTSDVISYLERKGINAIFNAPYCSIFNDVELSFRAIKKITYANIYDNIEKVICDVEKYLTGNNINNALLYNYKETINEYIYYSKEHTNMNLNNLKISE